MRIVVPAGAAAMVAAAAAGRTADGADVIAVAVAVLASGAVLMPWIGEAWIDGSAYGPERRLPLRPPVLVAVLLAPLTWLVVVVGVAAGPLLLAAERWVPGVAALIVGWLAAVIGVRSLHQLSRRFVVLVAAGLVLHDPLVMPEPQLFLRRTIARLGPAPADSTADDLTAGAAGLALELVLTELVELLLRRGRTMSETHPTTALLFTPSRPGHVLDAAGDRRVAVG